MITRSSDSSVVTVFGGKFESLWDDVNQTIPVVRMLLDWLVQMDFGATPVLFQSASPSLIRELRRQLDSGNALSFSQIEPIYVHQLLLEFITELSTPIIPQDIAYDLMVAAGKHRFCTLSF